MSALYPLKFTPILKARIWGGTKLKTSLNKPKAQAGIGESWEISTVPGSVSKVCNGALKGLSLTQLIKENKELLVGARVYEQFGAAFPILIKFIDAAQDLSIQVHPNNALAMKRHGCTGKTEMWYVMEAAPEAELIVGFKPGMDAQQYTQHIAAQTLETVLERYPVQEGSTFFIETGTVHAIGAGVLLAEIQQTSDITYRVFDFNRKDAQGNTRELHTQQALAALNFKHKAKYNWDYNTQTNTPNPMVASPYFTTRYLPVKGTYHLPMAQTEGFRILLCVKGQGVVTNAFGSENVQYGETLLLAANSKFISIKSPALAVFLLVFY